jgi:hypothetical protein
MSESLLRVLRVRRGMGRVYAFLPCKSNFSRDVSEVPPLAEILIAAE